MTSKDVVADQEPGSICGAIWAGVPYGIGPDGRGSDNGHTGYRICQEAPGDHSQHRYFMYRDVRPCEILLHGAIGRQAQCRAYEVGFWLERVRLSAANTERYWRDCEAADRSRHVAERGRLDFWMAGAVDGGGA